MGRVKSRLFLGSDDVAANYTREEIAAELGVSRERVRQIEARALFKLRDGLLSRGFRVEDLVDIDPRAHRAHEEPRS